MTTNAQIGFGVKFAVEDAAGSGNYIEMVELFDITTPTSKTDTVDVTHMQSPNFRKEFLAALIDEGEVTFQLNGAPGSASDVALRGWRDAREKRACKITFGNAHVWSFSALATDYAMTSPMADKMVQSLTAKVSGSISLT